MAGVATLSAALIFEIVMLLVLTVMILSIWIQNGGPEALARVIYQIGDTIGWLISSAIDWGVNTAWPWITEVFVPTATAVWEGTLAYVDAKAEVVVKDIADAWTKARDTTLKKTTGVYEIYVENDGEYKNYFFGGFNMDIMIPDQTEGSRTYKYGTTTMATIRERYPASGRGRTGYIGTHLKLGNFISKFFYVGITDINPKNWNTFEAKALEKQLLLAYCLQHYGYFPPGNTKFG